MPTANRYPEIGKQARRRNERTTTGAGVDQQRRHQSQIH
jgi:hypothetical protein